MSSDDLSCIQCGGFWSRPGKFGCDLPGHPSPTLAQRIALAIENDLNDRRGFHMSTLDNDTNREILDRWAELIEAELSLSSSR
jgi:hypothetical protein